MTQTEFEQRKQTEQLLLVDIREPEELVSWPGPEGSVNIPLSTLAQADAAGKLPKDKTIVTICRSGARCVVVIDYLETHGYQAEIIDGGLLEWQGD